jgi:predicted DNA-binding transcriptional regulator YafY
MENRLRKTERLIKIWLLLINNPFRLTTKDLSDRFNVTMKTIYRDMETVIRG